MKSEGSASLSDSIIQQGQLKYLFLHWQGVFNSDNIQDHTMNLSRRRVRFRFQSFYVYSTWYLNQFEFYKRRSAVLKSQSIIEQLCCTDFYKFLNVWLFLNDWLFLNVLMFDHPPTHPPPYDPPPLKCSIPHSYLIRARSTAHSKIFLYKSFFKGLYYTLSHTYNAYTFFSIFLLSNMIYLFFFWKLLCIVRSP